MLTLSQPSPIHVKVVMLTHHHSPPTPPPTSTHDRWRWCCVTRPSLVHAHEHVTLTRCNTTQHLLQHNTTQAAQRYTKQRKWHWISNNLLNRIIRNDNPLFFKQKRIFPPHFPLNMVCPRAMLPTCWLSHTTSQVPELLTDEPRCATFLAIW